MTNHQTRPGTPATAFTVSNPDGLDLDFTGWQLLDTHHQDTGFVRIYRTRGGRFILRQRLTGRPGVILRDRLFQCDTLDAALDQLPPGPGSNAIRRQLGLPGSVWIE